MTVGVMKVFAMTGVLLPLSFGAVWVSMEAAMRQRGVRRAARLLRRALPGQLFDGGARDAEACVAVGHHLRLERLFAEHDQRLASGGRVGGVSKGGYVLLTHLALADAIGEVA